MRSFMMIVALVVGFSMVADSADAGFRHRRHRARRACSQGSCQVQSQCDFGNCPSN